MTPEDQQQSPLQSMSRGNETVRDQDKIQLVLSYFSILCLIPLLTVKDSKFVNFHAKQGLVLTGGVIAFNIALTILASIFAPIGMIGCLVGPVYLVVSILGIVKSLKGEWWRIPGVADLADKISL
jgi:uncharacterized membrane protein